MPQYPVGRIGSVYTTPVPNGVTAVELADGVTNPEIEELDALATG